MQQGCVIRSERKPDVWQFRWSEIGPQRQRVYRDRVVGIVEDYPDSEAVHEFVKGLITKSRVAKLHSRPLTMTVGELWETNWLANVSPHLLDAAQDRGNGIQSHAGTPAAFPAMVHNRRLHPSGHAG